MGMAIMSFSTCSIPALRVHCATRHCERNQKTTGKQRDTHNLGRGKRRRGAPAFSPTRSTPRCRANGARLVLPHCCPRYPRKICWRSEEHTSELQSLMRSSYAVFCLKKHKQSNINDNYTKHITSIVITT